MYYKRVNGRVDDFRKGRLLKMSNRFFYGVEKVLISLPRIIDNPAGIIDKRGQIIDKASWIIDIRRKKYR